MSSDPAKVKPKAHGQRRNIMNSDTPVCGGLSAHELETLFTDTLQEATNLSNDNEITTATTNDVIMAKMLRNCIRMLHSNSWVPRTVVRAMVHMEADAASGTERSVKSTMYHAMREKRDEARARRTNKKASDATPEELDDYDEPVDTEATQGDSAGVSIRDNGKGGETAATAAGAGANVGSGSDAAKSDVTVVAAAPDKVGNPKTSKEDAGDKTSKASKTADSK